MIAEKPKMDLDKITPDQWKKMGVTREKLEEGLAKMQERQKPAC